MEIQQNDLNWDFEPSFITGVRYLLLQKETDCGLTILQFDVELRKQVAILKMVNYRDWIYLNINF